MEIEVNPSLVPRDQRKRKVDSNENPEGSYVVRSSVGDRSKEGNEAVVRRFSYGYKQKDERNKPKQTNNWNVPICDRNKSSQDDGLPPISWDNQRTSSITKWLYWIQVMCK